MGRFRAFCTSCLPPLADWRDECDYHRRHYELTRGARTRRGIAEPWVVGLPRRHEAMRSNAEQVEQVLCGFCLALVVRRRQSGQPRKYCGAWCRKQMDVWRRQPKHPRAQCDWCFCVFAQRPRSNPSPYCSQRCASAARQHQKTWKHPDRCDLRACIDCGDLTGGRPQAIRCIPCQESAYAKQRNRSMARRHLAIRTGDRDIHWSGLIARDGDRCRWCRRRVRPDLGPLHDLFPTVEHLTPIARGGTHTWDNVELACRSCNLRRYVGGVTQLRLVG